MLNSLLLSIFSFVFFLFSIWYFEKADFTFLEKGKQLKLSAATLILIFCLVIVLVGFISWFIINKGSQNSLQNFYILIYTLGFLLTWLLVLPKSKVWISLAVIFTAILLTIIWQYHSQLLQNIFMAASVLWVGPAIFKKLNLKLKYFLLFIIVFLAIDIYNVYFYKPNVAFSDETLLLNGLIIFGSSLLGIGDFFLSYLTVNAVQKDISKLAAIILALVIAFARFFIHLSLPNYHGNIAYSIVIVPATLIAYLFYRPIKLGSS